MIMSEPEDRFDYEGRLVFNGTFKTDIFGADLNPERVIEDLPEYEQGSPQQPGYGFTDIDLEELAVSNLQSNGLIELAENTISFRYTQEDFQEEEIVDIEGNSEIRYSRRLQSVDFYWVFPEFLFVRGPKSEVKKAVNKLKAVWERSIELSKLDFEPDFLIWLIYKHYNGEDLNTGINIIRLTDAKIQGSHDVFGSTRRISDSTDLVRSPPVITAILQNEDIVTIGGEFLIDNRYQLSVDISTDGRTHIKAQSNDIREANSLERVLISILFVENICEIYTDWLELDPSEKYPPVDFFEELYQSLENQGISTSFTLDSVIDEYTAKRGEQ